MKRTTKYVALDVPQATTVASVREESGRVIARTILPTEAPAIVEWFRGMRGAVHVTFAAGARLRARHWPTGQDRRDRCPGPRAICRARPP